MPWLVLLWMIQGVRLIWVVGVVGASAAHHARPCKALTSLDHPSPLAAMLSKRALLSAHLLAAFVFCCSGCHLCVSLQLPGLLIILRPSGSLSACFVYHGAAHCAPFCTDTCLWLIRLHITEVALQARHAFAACSALPNLAGPFCMRGVAHLSLVIERSRCTRVSCVACCVLPAKALPELSAMHLYSTAVVPPPRPSKECGWCCFVS